MALPQGVPFRTTAGFVTDLSGDDPEFFASGTFGTTYPRTTAQGNTVGWEGVDTIVTRDREAGNDSRLAGIQGNNGPATAVTYRIDLPSAGSYLLNWASGDADYVNGSAVDLYDGASRLRALSTGTTSAANRDVELTNITWPTSNTAITATFASTICRFTSVPNGSNTMCFTYFKIQVAPSAITSSIRLGRSRKQQAAWSVTSPGGFF